MKTRPCDPVRTVSFHSQFMFPIRGLMACTVIARVLASRILRMSNEEFFNIFQHTDNTKIAQQILNSCLEAGVNLKSKISPGLFGGWIKSHYHEDSIKIGELNENYAGVCDLQTVSEMVIGISVEILQNSFKSLIDLYETYFATNNLQQNNPDNLCFIATTNGHTTVFLAKLNPNDNIQYFISIDSFSKCSQNSGELQIYDTFDALAQSLIQKWGNGSSPTVDITITCLDSRPRLGLSKK